MQPYANALVYIVDDDQSVRHGLAWLLHSRRLLSESFDSADSFIKTIKTNWRPEQPSCLLLDVRMPGTSGLALFEILIERKLLHIFPIIFLTGHADIPTAVNAVKQGAFDFCEKPFSGNDFVDRVEAALKSSDEKIKKAKIMETFESRRAGLTERESDVMRFVFNGCSNKVIADQLHISVRTVEVHRSRVFEKMEVRSAVELANAWRAAH
ncbi:MAG: response regulator transcription factor [Limnohabitans sp.]|nr:response regulator transcription factor [Limnohabitans sp.]